MLRISFLAVTVLVCLGAARGNGDAGKNAGMSDTIAVFESDANSSKLAELLNLNGLKTKSVSTDDLLRLGELRPSVILIAPGMKYPAKARKSLAEYLSKNGRLVLLEPEAFNYDLKTEGFLPLVEFSDVNRAKVRMPEDAEGKKILKRLVEIPGQNEKAIEITTPEIGLGDVFVEVPVKKADAHNVICFWAKGDFEADMLAIVLKDSSSNKFTAFVELGSGWNYYEISFSDFLSADPNKAGTINAADAKSVSFGISPKFLWLDKGCTFAVGKVALARTSQWAGVPTQQLRRWRVPLNEMKISYPEWIISPFLDCKKISGAAVESAAGPIGTQFSEKAAGPIWTVPAYEVNAKSTVAMGSDKEILEDLQRDSMRRIPILIVIDANHRKLGTAAEYRFHTGGYYNGAAMALFGLKGVEYSKDSALGKVLVETIRYMVHTPKAVHIRTYTPKVAQDPCTYLFEVMVNNPGNKKITATVKVNLADGMMSGSKQTILLPNETAAVVVALGQVPAKFPLTKFNWRVEVAGDDAKDAWSDTADVEKTCIRAAKNMLHLMSTNADGRISNHFFADAYGARALYALGLYLKDPAVLARNADVLKGAKPEDFTNASLRFFNMIVKAQEPEGCFPLGYHEMQNIRWVADNGSVALALAQMSTLVDKDMATKYLNAAGKYCKWAETYWISSEKSERLRKLYTDEKSFELTKPGGYGLGYMVVDWVTKKPWKERRREERGPDFVLGCAMGIGAAMKVLEPNNPIHGLRAVRDCETFLKANHSAEGYFQSEGMFWMYMCLDDPNVKASIKERLESTFLPSCIRDSKQRWFYAGGRGSLFWLPFVYYYHTFEDSPRMRAALIRAIWEHCSDSSSYSVAAVAEKYTHTSHGSAIAASKYAGSCSAPWMIELLRPGSTLMKNYKFK